MSHTSNAGIFLLQALFGILILLMLLRFLFQLMRVDYYNPISQMVNRFSDPILTPLRRILPSGRRIDSASLTLLFVLQYIQLLTITQVRDLSANPLGLALLASSEILALITSILFWSILILAVLSWFQPRTQHPGINILSQLTEPLMQPIRRLVPASGGVDFSPIIALLGIKVAEFVVIAPIRDLAAHLLQ